MQPISLPLGVTLAIIIFIAILNVSDEYGIDKFRIFLRTVYFSIIFVIAVLIVSGLDINMSHVFSTPLRTPIVEVDGQLYFSLQKGTIGESFIGSIPAIIPELLGGFFRVSSIWDLLLQIFYLASYVFAIIIVFTAIGGLTFIIASLGGFMFPPFFLFQSIKFGLISQSDWTTITLFVFVLGWIVFCCSYYWALGDGIRRHTSYSMSPEEKAREVRNDQYAKNEFRRRQEFEVYYDDF